MRRVRPGPRRPAGSAGRHADRPAGRSPGAAPPARMVRAVRRPGPIGPPRPQVRRGATARGSARRRRSPGAGVGSGSVPAIVVPVPVHADRERIRGYDQATLIAAVAARHLGLPMLVRAGTRPRDRRAVRARSRCPRRECRGRLPPASSRTGRRPCGRRALGPARRRRGDDRLDPGRVRDGPDRRRRGRRVGHRRRSGALSEPAAVGPRGTGRSGTARTVVYSTCV